MLLMFLRFHLLEIHFYYNEYQHFPRCLNTLTDELVNYVLDKHLQHL